MLDVFMQWRPCQANVDIGDLQQPTPDTRGPTPLDQTSLKTACKSTFCKLVESKKLVRQRIDVIQGRVVLRGRSSIR